MSCHAKKFWGILSLITVLAAALLVANVSGDEIFGDRFEPVGWTPVIFATVELRDPDGMVRAAVESGATGNFPAFPTGMIESGDSIVVFGGLWEGTQFAGEFRLLLVDPDGPQIVTPITTLVSAVAKADFISGDTTAERLSGALNLLIDLYMVGADWNTINPSRTSVSLESIEAAGGIQNWVLALLPHIEAGEIPNDWMAQFPATNAGVLELVGFGDRFLWLPQDTGLTTLAVASLLEPEPDWAFALHSGPDWVEIDNDGVLSYIVPDDEPIGQASLEIAVTNLGTGQSRIAEAPYLVQEGEVVAEISVGAGGGTIWHPSGLFGIEAPEDTFTDTVTLQLLDIVTDEEGIRSRFRILPLGAEMNKGLIFRLAEEPESGLAGRGVPASCAVPSELLEGGWSPRSCVMGAFLEVTRLVCGVDCYHNKEVSLQRLPEGQSAYNLPDIGDYSFSEPTFAPASVLTARCTDCAGKTPLVFVHGYKGREFFDRMPPFSGGQAYWGGLRQLFHDFNDGNTFAVYEFRYRSNARFQDIARDLGNALELVASETGQKAHIVAHSFGGLVARTYLQGLTSNAAPISGFSGCDTSRHPYVESLVTMGSPHSGIASSPVNQHNIWMPDGRDASYIWTCGQLSCWQAGAVANVFFGASAPDLSGFFGVADMPGEIIAGLANFSANPLPVATRVLVSLDWSSTGSNTGFESGDSLISYQGQRFSPLLSCNGSNCQNQRIALMTRLEIAGQSLGHCLTESVLGATTLLQPLPNEPVPQGGGLQKFYKHSAGTLSSTATAQPVVSRSAHLPHLNPDGSGSWASNHDTFNQLHDWLGIPPERNVLVRILGQGSVQVESGGEQYPCPVSCFVPLPPGAGEVTATLTANPAAGAAFDRYEGCPSVSGNQCSLSVGPRTSVVARFTGGGQALLEVNVNGSGTVTVTPGDHSCSDNCSYDYAPGTEVSLSASGGAFNGWSGACSGTADCPVTLGPAGTTRSATASFGSPAPPAITTGLLNDTGIDWCANNTTNFLDCPVASHPGQDGDHGRDALARAGQLTKVGAGAAGFDYTKLDANGNALPASATSWSCVRDNHTGLIWEVKVNNPSHLRHRDHTYTWYNPDPNTNGGNAGTQNGGTCSGSSCDTHGFVQAVNNQGLCGASDWRMPTRMELRSLTHLGRINPSIDTNYFPQTASSLFWSASPSAGHSLSAWSVFFSTGLDYWSNKGGLNRVRLVRGGQ